MPAPRAKGAAVKSATAKGTAAKASTSKASTSKATAGKGTSRASKRKESAARSQPTPPPPQEEKTEPQLPIYTPLQTAVSTCFANAQRTTAGHRKLATNLRNIHEQCEKARGVGASTGGGRAGEKAFGKEFIRNLNKVLLVKKGEIVGDRCLRFCEHFVRHSVDKDELLKKKQPENEDEEQLDDAAPRPTPTSRFVLSLLKYLTPFLASKEKTVRYRTAQFIALLLTNAIFEFPVDMDLETFRRLKNQLAKRLHDKEAPVRVQAVVGLVRLLEMGVDQIEGDDSADDSDDGVLRKGGLIGAIIASLQNDSSADVRRIILYNLSPTQNSIPYLLERTRDVDNITRRAVFNRLLPSLGDFRHLSISMREKLLRWGLNDRDEGVRAAAGKMFNYRWIEDANGDLLEVLERMHVVGSANNDTTNNNTAGGVKELAMKGFWDERKDVVDGLELDHAYWDNLTPESAFLVRSFNDWCRAAKHQGKFESLVEEKLPEVTKLAYHLQIQLNKLIALLNDEADVSKMTEEDDASNDSTEQEFIVVQLLMIAVSMDYGDEIGRRKMFQLLRDSLAIVELPEAVTKLVVQCLAKLSLGEADFSAQLMQEAGHIPKKARLSGPEPDEALKEKSKAATAGPSKKRQRDPDAMDVDDEEEEYDEDENDEEAETKAFKILMNNIKTLHLAQYMLENVSGSLTQNTHLVSMLNGLVVPAVRSHEAIIRELGLRCLGLSCLLDRNLAEENLTLFAHCFNKGHEALQIEALRIISDMLMVHGAALFEGEACRLEQKTLYKLLGKAVKLEDNVEVQAAAAELLKALVIAYFDPLTRDNLSLRQTLSYFFPVYCHSRPENQERMQEIAVSALHFLISIHDSLEADEEMVSPSVIATHLVDWTDPRKQVGFSAPKPNNLISSGATSRFTEKIQNPNTHAYLASDILDRVSGSGCNKEERKLLLNMLGKLYIPKEANRDALRGCYERVALAVEKKVAVDAVGRNMLNKLEVTLGKIVSELGEEDEEEEDGDGAGAGRDEDEEMGGEEDEEMEVKSENGDEEEVALEDIEEVREDEDEECLSK
ncbi:nuclear condensing complex subunit [Terfezia claveryi]|nr:nuclear condensing complex subunit [Terfezia claveryi]